MAAFLTPQAGYSASSRVPANAAWRYGQNTALGGGAHKLVLLSVKGVNDSQKYFLGISVTWFQRNSYLADKF